MDFVRDVKAAFRAVWLDRKVVLPELFLGLVFLSVVSSFFIFSGLAGPSSEFLRLAQEYRSQKEIYLATLNFSDPGYLAALETEYGDSPEAQSRRSAEFSAYLVAHNFSWSGFYELVTVQNAVLLLVHIGLFVVAAIYLGSLKFAFSALASTGRKVRWREGFRLSHSQVLWMVCLSVLLVLVYLSPLFLLGFFVWLVALFFPSGTYFPVTVLSVLMLFVVFIVVYASLVLRFLFSFQVMYVDDAGPFAALRNSFEVTRGRKLRAFGVLVAFLAITGGASSLLAAPMYQAFFYLIVASSPVAFYATLVFVLGVLVLFSFVSSVGAVYLFVAYRNFRKP
ncbi:hypothetical protein HY640_03040 [Candidatus Woesearchaeota archaeon]|nr:hypothetical protein [Candidatus Woesearchaeota archaeon]